MARKKVFISFDYDNDRNYRYLLSALAANAGSAIDLRIVRPAKFNQTMWAESKQPSVSGFARPPILSLSSAKHANHHHRQQSEIGTRNWQWWEIEKSAEDGNRFIAVRIDSSNDSPTTLLGKRATWAQSFRVDRILRAINSA